METWSPAGWLMHRHKHTHTHTYIHIHLKGKTYFGQNKSVFSWKAFKWKLHNLIPTRESKVVIPKIINPIVVVNSSQAC